MSATHTRDLRLMGGLRGQLQYLPFFLMFFVAALVGVPGLGNFIGEFDWIHLINILYSRSLLLSALYLQVCMA